MHYKTNYKSVMDYYEPSRGEDIHQNELVTI